MRIIHFGSYDDRFCGSRQQGRQFTVDENEVTCAKCKANDRLTLTPQGRATVAAMEAL